MRLMGFRLASIALLFSTCLETFAMTSEATRLVLYKRGETIAGEEFLSFDEAIVDYLATLKRPTENLKVIKYNCLSKSRAIRPSVQGFSSTTQPNSEWVELRVVYELRDCTELP